MSVVIIEAAAPVGSWRLPEALTYHRTLPLPPYTSLVGMLGAALGLGLPDAYRFIAERGLRLGVGGWHEGRMRDLWKFQKLGDKEVKTDVLLRECCTDVAWHSWSKRPIRQRPGLSPMPSAPRPIL